MKYFVVKIYKKLGDGEIDDKGVLMETSTVPAVFETTEAAFRTANITVNALNKHMYSAWGFTIVEGFTI